MPAGRVSHANRGKGLEIYVDQANAAYLSKQLAVVQKVAVPTQVVSDRRGNTKVIRRRSTVDYIGVWQGRPIAFDAKETHLQRFPLDNIHEHQYEFLRNWDRAGGLAFLLVYYGPDATVYFMHVTHLALVWNLRLTGGLASIPGDAVRQLPKVRAGRGCTIDYLSTLEDWLNGASASGGLE